MPNIPKKENTTNKRVISFRPEKDLDELIEKWLTKNQNIKQSTLINMAIKEFITHPHTLEPVTTVMASKQEVAASIKKMMIEHADALDKLK